MKQFKQSYESAQAYAEVEKLPVGAYKIKIENVRYEDNSAKANYSASVYQECIDYAQGNSQLFTQELQRRTKDDTPLRGLNNIRRN